MSVDGVRHDPRRDVATRVSDLPAADLLGCPARAFGRVQGRGDLGAAPPTGRPAAAGRPSPPVGGESSLSSAMARILSTTRRRHLFVTPGTLLRWHTDLVKRRWTFTRRRA